MEDSEGNSPMHYACDSNNVECIRLLARISRSSILRVRSKSIPVGETQQSRLHSVGAIVQSSAPRFASEQEHDAAPYTSQVRVERLTPHVSAHWKGNDGDAHVSNGHQVVSPEPEGEACSSKEKVACV